MKERPGRVLHRGAWGLQRCAGRAILLVALAASGAGGCSSAPLEVQEGTAEHAGARRGGALPLASLPAGAGGASAAERGPGVRSPLGAPKLEPLEFSIESSLDGRSVLFVSKTSSERAGWVRSADSATGELGPALRLDGEDLVGALGAPGGNMTLLTSREGRLCLVTFRRGEPEPASRKCGATSARAVAAVGDRLALLEVEEIGPPEPATAKGKKAVRAADRGGVAKPAVKKKGEGGAKASGAKASSAKASSAKASGAKASGAKASGAKSGASKRRDERAARAGKGKGGGRAQTRPARPLSRREVEVFVRWVAPDGTFDATVSPTGLRFRPPLEGMTLIDAVGRSGSIDVLHYAEAPKRPSASSYGSARIVGASLGEDGRFDPTRSVTVAEGDLDYGFLRGHEQPRLIATAAGSVYVGMASRAGPCEAAQLAPPFGRFSGAPCEVDPARLALSAPLTLEEVSALDRIRGSGGRRAPLQPAQDGPLAAWVGDRGYYQIHGDLFSAAREDGLPRREEAPFPARRAHIAWGAWTAEGEGIAWAGDQLVRVSARGDIAGVAAPALPDPAAAAASTPAAAPASAPAILGEPDARADRRRAARIGSSWWIARTDVVRLLPSPLIVPDLRGRAHPDGAALVGGRERGLFLEVLGGRLQRTAVDMTGALTPMPSVPSPVRAGFDACERRAGGALIAGVSVSDPRRVVALALDEGDRVGPAYATSLPITEGHVAVRLVALPAGGALLHDLARRHVVWLSDEGAELAARAWPAGDTGANCVDGRPAPRDLPAPAPGVLIPAPDLAAPGACVVGDVAWAADGTLRWFGSTVTGLDAQAEAGLARVALPAAPPPAPAPVRAPAPAPVAVPAPAPALAPALAPAPVLAPGCPADMVAIDHGRYCIDRFESTLVDRDTGEALSPDYPPTPNLLEFTLADWVMGRQRIGDVYARAMPLPFLPAWQRGKKIAVVAVARFDARPSGYVTGLVAESACAAAGKRLCSPNEFLVACRGEDDTLFPYGDAFEDGACNVFRDGHPAAVLHGIASIGHLDPRLNRVRWNGQPLFREAGATPRCRSRWGGDAVYDLVGNLDEWVDDPGGAFAGGFYSRSTRAGCEALITAHPRTYADYSTGVRCCRDAAAAASSAAAP